MRKTTIIICVALYFLPHMEVWNNAPIENHFLYMFSHANIFHLLANTIALLSLKKLYPVSFIIAFIASFFPFNGMILGLSGVIFSQIGINIGKKFNKNGLYQNIIIACIFGMLPNMAILIHIYCLIIGFLIGNIIWMINIYKDPIYGNNK